MVMLDAAKYPWADALGPGDFISEKPTYESGKYLDLFEERVFAGCDERVGSLRYYVYDPIKHGRSADKDYPVIFALHGANASLAGKIAIAWAGVEQFASPDYQDRMGGAYIVCPMANETGNEENPMTWMTPLSGGGLQHYSPALQAALRPYLPEGSFLLSLLGSNSIYSKTLRAVLAQARASFSHAGKTILMGTSAGGYAAWRCLISDTQLFDAALIMAPAYIPTDGELAKLKEFGVPIWLCHGQRDEMVPFDMVMRPILPILQQMPNVETYFPALVRHGDRGVSSNMAGMQMGQHCINDAVQQDLLFDDGEPYDPNHPDGVTGWIRKHA